MLGANFLFRAAINLQKETSFFIFKANIFAQFFFNIRKKNHKLLF